MNSILLSDKVKSFSNTQRFLTLKNVFKTTVDLFDSDSQRDDFT